MKVFKSATISLKTTRWSFCGIPSVIRWEYKCCFRYNLLIRFFVLHNCSNFNYNAAMIFFFKTFLRIWFERLRCIYNVTFRSLCCFSSIVHVESISSNLTMHHPNPFEQIPLVSLSAKKKSDVAIQQRNIALHSYHHKKSYLELSWLNLALILLVRKIKERE